MAFCPECGNEIKKGSLFCGNCGYSLKVKKEAKKEKTYEVYEKVEPKKENEVVQVDIHENEIKDNKTVSNYPAGSSFTTNSTNMNKIFGILFISLGVISLCFGLSINYDGALEENKSYGGDAYTGMQNASAQTANNVYYLGKSVCNGFKVIIATISASFIIHGVKTLNKKEN